MDARRHQLAQSRIDEPVALQRRQAVKRRADQQQTVVPAAAGGAGVAGMGGTLVLDLEALGGKIREQGTHAARQLGLRLWRAHLAGPPGAGVPPSAGVSPVGGAVSGKWRATMIPVPIEKARVRPIAPKVLKLTQADVLQL